MQCQACARYVPYESVFWLPGNKQAKDFIIRVHLCRVVQSSRPVRCVMLCTRTPPPHPISFPPPSPPPSVCMSSVAQMWSFQSIVQRWEVIMAFLLLGFFKICFFPSSQSEVLTGLHCSDTVSCLHGLRLLFVHANQWKHLLLTFRWMKVTLPVWKEEWNCAHSERYCVQLCVLKILCLEDFFLSKIKDSAGMNQILVFLLSKNIIYMKN